MSKNTIKTIIMVVAIILALSLAGGWIAQTVITKQEQEQHTPVTQTEGCFVVTPENEDNGIMTLSAQLYATAADDETPINERAAAFYKGDLYVLTVNVTSLQGNDEVEWEMNFANPDSQYATGNSVENYIELERHATNTHTVRLHCLQPFMEKIVVKASIKNNPDKYVICVCDYEQRYVYSLILGDYLFRSDGVFTETNGSRVIRPYPTYTMDFTQSVPVEYSVVEDTTLYTKQSARYKISESNVHFTLEPTAACRSIFGSKTPMTYEGGSGGTFEHFFDLAWAYAENGDYSIVNALSQNGRNVPLYTVTMTGAPSGDVVFDLYFNFVLPDDYISINTNQVTF